MLLFALLTLGQMSWAEDINISSAKGIYIHKGKKMSIHK